MLDRIRIDPGVCGGRPTIRGLRMTVEFVLKLLGDGYSAADISLAPPVVSRVEHVNAALQEVLPTLEDAVRAGVIATVQDARIRVRQLPLS